MAPRDVVLAVDAGTSGVRACVFSKNGAMLRHIAKPIGVTVRNSFSECDAAELWGAVSSAVEDVIGDPRLISGVGVTAALGLILVDSHGKPLTPIITWQDRRAFKEADDIATRIGVSRIYGITGRRSDPELVAPKLVWFARHAPDLLRQAAHVLSVKDWLVSRLCGRFVTDATSASYSLLFDVERGQWSEELIRELALPRHLFPTVRDASTIAGQVTESAAHHSKLLTGTPVIVGGPDGTMGGIGGGLVMPGVAVDVIGTTDVIFAFTNRPAFDERRRLVINKYPIGQAWSVGGPMSATGGAVNWFANILGQDLKTLTSEAISIAPGCSGLMISPSFGGSRTPRWDAHERGSITGLGFDHNRGHLFRALLEGCAYEVSELFDALDEQGVKLDEVRVVGGGTENALWLAIRAAVLGRTLVIPEISEASALGTAIVTTVGVGLNSDLSAACRTMIRVGRRVEPDPIWVESYAKLKASHREFRDRTGFVSK